MAGSANTHQTDYRIVNIKTIEGSTIQGRVNISPEQRVSDLLSRQKEPFLVVVDASYMNFKDKTLFINKEHILWIEPED